MITFWYQTIQNETGDENFDVAFDKEVYGAICLQIER